MTKIIREIQIDIPKEKVWQVMADFGGVQNYNPNVKKSYATSKANGGLGATRHCDLTMFGASVEERITDWQEGRKYTIEVYDSKKAPPFKESVAYLAVRDDGRGGSIVTGAFYYALKFGPIGFLMDQLIVKSQFEKGFTRLLAGLKHHCETGETVDTDTAVNTSAVFAAA